jgi:hypothetical protein
MGIKEEIDEVFKLVRFHTDDIEQLNIFIRMKNGTIFRYKIDKKKEFRLKLKEGLQKLKDKKEREKIAKKSG